MLDLNVDRVSEKESEQGKWFEYAEGLEFLIGRWNNKKHNKALEHMAKRYSKEIESKRMSNEKAERLFVEAMIGNVLLDWRGLMNGNQPFPFSPDNARDLLLHPEYIEIKDWIVNISQEMENFRIEHKKK